MTFTRNFPFIILLLAAACTTSPGGGQPGDPFVAQDEAPDADRDSGRVADDNESEQAPLTSKEEGDAALLVDELEQTDHDERDDIIEELVALGPRYLEFLRSIDSEVAAIDLMYVIRRIERAHSIDRPEDQTDDVEVDEGRGEPQVEADDELPDPPEYDPDQGGYDRDAVERFMQVRLEQAQRMVDRGQHDSAIRIADAALVLMPQSRLRPDFETLIRRARGESQADLLIAGTLSVSPENLQYEREEVSSPFREALEIRCFLKNVSTDEITLRVYEGDERESVLRLTVAYEQVDFIGTAYNYSGNVNIPVDGDGSITLAPNDSYSLTVPLDGLSSLDYDAPLKYALGRVEIDAALRVYGALDHEGEPLVLRPVEFPQRSVLLFPAEFDLAGAEGNGLGALQKAIEKGEPQDLFMAAHLVERDDRRAAGDALLKDYDRSVIAMQRARLASLSVIFDVGRSWQIRRWREWWDENRRRQ